VAIGNKDIKTVVKSLKANRFDPVEFAEEGDTATRLALDMIPLEAIVGVPGSSSVRQIGLVSQLKRRGTTVIDIWEPSKLSQEEGLRQSLCSDILLTSSNAVTLDGKLVNIDGIGNRVAGMIFGPKKVIFVIGTNKLVRDVDEAIYRIKNTTTPYHAKHIGAKTPCAVLGHCTDCKTPERACNITTIIEGKPRFTDIAVILVDEDLGLGWNPDWPEARKERIASVYRETLNVRKR